MTNKTECPNCPNCCTGSDVIDLGVDSNIRQHRHSYRCKKCGNVFYVPMGEETAGDWLMTIHGAKPDGQFVALFKTSDGHILVNRRSNTQNGFVYVSGRCTPQIAVMDGANCLTVSTPMKDARRLPPMEILRIEWSLSMKSQLLSGPDEDGTHEGIRNDKTTLWHFNNRENAQFLCKWLQNVIQQQTAAKHPDKPRMPSLPSFGTRCRPEIHGSDLLTLFLIGAALVWLVGSIVTLGFSEGLIYGLGIPFGILILLGIIFGGW